MLDSVRMWLDDLGRDVRYALRTFARSPLFALTAIVSIAIGIGADTALFSVANALLLRPPAGVHAHHELVAITATDGRDRFGVNEISFPNFADLRERATTLTDFYGYEPTAQPMSLSIGAGAERVFGHRVTPNYFAALGVGASAGRVFDQSSRDGDAVMLSHEFWVRRFERDASIVGTTIAINSRRATVVGIAAEGFRGTSLVATDVWTPLETTVFDGSFLARRDLGWALVGARLKPGVSRSQAGAELDAIALALGREYRETNVGRGFQVARASLIPGNLSVPLAGVLTLLLAFVSLVLVIACANLVGLLLSRAIARRREIAVRVALGAGRRRVIQQLATEVLLLFAAGGGGGVLLAYALTTTVENLLPLLSVPIGISLVVDLRVLAFTLGLSLVAGLVCALVPALQTSRPNVVSALKDDGYGTSRRARLRHASVICQVAASVVLVAATAVFVRALERATSIDPGFDPSGVELATIDLSLAGYTPDSGRVFLRDLAARVRALPAVDAATITAAPPTGGVTRFGILTHPGVQPGSGDGTVPADWNVVEPGYFETLRVALMRGRDFTAADTATSEPVMIVSEEAARRFWPGQDPIDRFLLQHAMVVRRGDRNAPKALRVVGVVSDVKAPGRDTPRPYVYLALQQQYVPSVTIAVRARDARRLDRDLRNVIAEMNPNLPVLNSQTMEEAIAFALVSQRVAASVSSVLGVVALILAAIGIYGLVAFTVADRTREIGVRVALGAQKRQVVTFVLGGAMRLTLIGCAIGVGGAVLAQFALTRVSAFPSVDPFAFAFAIAIFAATAIAATCVPVRRALALDPIVTLRYE